jgi:hypothetical protein
MSAQLWAKNVRCANWTTENGVENPSAVRQLLRLRGKAHESAVQGSCRPAVGMFAAFMGLAAAHPAMATIPQNPSRCQGSSGDYCRTRHTSRSGASGWRGSPKRSASITRCRTRFQLRCDVRIAASPAERRYLRRKPSFRIIWRRRKIRYHDVDWCRCILAFAT